MERSTRLSCLFGLCQCSPSAAAERLEAAVVAVLPEGAVSRLTPAPPELLVEAVEHLLAVERRCSR